MNKEEIYDQKINPLMNEIISICEHHKIAMLMSFAIPTDDNPDLSCTTALLSSDYQPHDSQIAAYHKIMHGAHATTLPSDD